MPSVISYDEIFKDKIVSQFYRNCRSKSERLNNKVFEVMQRNKNRNIDQWKR